MTEAALREAIVRFGRSLFERGLTFGSSGNISARTAEDHRYNISRKLGLESQTDVVLFALRRGILVVDDVGGAPRLD